jgi:hypothetical protein
MSFKGRQLQISWKQKIKFEKARFCISVMSFTLKVVIAAEKKTTVSKIMSSGYCDVLV